MLRHLIPIVAFVTLGLAATPAVACINAMAKHKASEKIVVAPTDLQAIVAWHDGTEDLVLTVGYRSTLEKAEPLAFVIPVPTVPTSYEVVDGEIFDQLRGHVGLQREKFVQMRSRGPLKMAKKNRVRALEKLPSALAGPYEIQPLKASGAEGLAALQEWMKKNQFQEVNPDDAAYYVERGWTFLAVKATPEDETRMKGTMPPLHLKFASKRAVLPLKLLQPPERMKVTAYVIKKLRVGESTAKAISEKGFEVVRGDDYTFAKGAPAGSLVVSRGVVDRQSAPELVKKFVAGLGWKDVPKPRVAVFHSESFGVAPARPQDWDEDFVVPALNEGEKLYGGDRMPSAAGNRLTEAIAVRDGIESGELDIEKVVPGSSDGEGGRAPTETTGGPIAQPKEDAEPPMLFTSCSQVPVDGRPGVLLLLVGFAFVARRRRR